MDKESACNAGDLGSIPELGRFPGEENDNPLQYACLGNPMDRGAWLFLKHLLNLLQYCFCFMFWFFGCEARGI